MPENRSEGHGPLREGSRGGRDTGHRLERRARGDIAWWTDPVLSAGGVEVGLTERHGGVGRSPYDSLNLAEHVGDDPAAVSANRRMLCEALGLGGVVGRVVTAEQVHGAEVAVVDEEDRGSRVPGVDALVTTARDVVLVLLFADCVPIVLAVPDGRGVALAHGGWRGLAAGVVGRTVDRLCAEARCTPSELVVHVGPHICAVHYEVGREVLSRFPGVLDTMAAAQGRLDLAEVTIRRLAQAGVSRTRVWPMGICTAERTDAFFSHRAEGTTGRHAAFAYLRASGRGCA